MNSFINPSHIVTKMKKYNLFKRLTYPFDINRNVNALSNLLKFHVLTLGFSAIVAPISLLAFPENYKQNLEDLALIDKTVYKEVAEIKMPDKVYRIKSKDYVEIDGVPIERYFK